MQTIRELGYQPSQLARGLRTNRTTMIGMFIPDIINPFFPAVVRGAEDVVYQNSYHLALCNTDQDPRKEASYFKSLRGFLPAGLIVIPSMESDLNALGPLPTVCVDRTPAGWGQDSVTVNNEAGAFDAVSLLLSMGHRVISMITGPQHYTNSVHRLQGMKHAMASAGLSLPPEYVQETSFTREGGRASTMRLLSLIPRPTAIFAANDLIALGSLEAFRESNLRCPEDISLIGFDGLDFTEFTNPPLTTVYQPGYQIGATAARLLIDRINGDESEPKRVVLEVELKIRNSVSRIQSKKRASKSSSTKSKSRS